jgi:sulfide:quinone oxidoreductase
VIAGGGVAALETVLALRDLAGERLSITIVAPRSVFTSSAMAVASVFARGHSRGIELAPLADDLVRGSVVEVDPSTRRIRCDDGTELAYDHLVLAVGAEPRRAWPHGIAFGEDPAEESLHGLLDEIERGFAKRVAFVVPAGPVWPLPLYELAMMTARQAWSMGMDEVRFMLVTPEERPLAVFGRRPSEAVGELLDDCGIEFVGSTYADVRHRYVELDPAGRRVTGARTVSLPVLHGPDVAGVPADPAGFVLTDPHGRVPALTGVYAAGDGTAFPIKQGGLATQQADAVAETIAAAMGAALEAEPFRPVLRATLLTGGDSRALEHAVAGGDGEGVVRTHPHDASPEKLSGRYLSPYLAALEGRRFARSPSRVAGLARSG